MWVIGILLRGEMVGLFGCGFSVMVFICILSEDKWILSFLYDESG